MLKVSVAKHRGAFTLDAKFESPTPGVVALFGRSGCGKTTTIDVMSGLLAADEAHIELDGVVLEDRQTRVSVPAEDRRIGYVFQDGRLFPHLNVLANLRYGLQRATRRGRGIGRGGGADARGGAAASGGAGGRGGQQEIGLDAIVSLLGLDSLLKSRPHQLSGGERQRVSLGRALLSQPRLLLLDEPLSALDAPRREEVLPYLEKLRDNLSIPMVYVSHQFDEVLRLATHVVLMDAGRVIAQGSLNEISLVPALRSIVGPDLVGAVVDGEVTAVDSASGMARLKLGPGALHVAARGVAVGEHVRVQLLARDIILATQAPRGLSVRNELSGRIVGIANDEDETLLVSIDIGGMVVLSRTTREAGAALGLREGLDVWVLVKAVSTRGHAFRMA
jgi:molybdate transport system ATP-binding protein